MKAILSGAGQAIRTSGQLLDKLGRTLEVNPYVERLLPQTQVVKFRGHYPTIDGAFIASTASVIGQVKIGSNSSVWYGAVLRGDDSSITVGNNVSIGDRVMIHASKFPKDTPTVVLDGAVVQMGAILHGCTVEAGAVIGEGAQVMDNARVGEQAYLLPGSVLATNKVVPPRQVWGGVPAKFERELSVAELASLEALSEENVLLAQAHAIESAKTAEQVSEDEFEWYQVHMRTGSFWPRLSKEEISTLAGEINYHAYPGRILDSPLHVSHDPEHANKA